MIKSQSPYYQLPSGQFSTPTGGMWQKNCIRTTIKESRSRSNPVIFISVSWRLKNIEWFKGLEICLQLPDTPNETHSTYIFSCLTKWESEASPTYIINILRYVLYLPIKMGTQTGRLKMSTPSDWYQRLVRPLWVPLFRLQSWVPCDLAFCFLPSKPCFWPHKNGGHADVFIGST